MSEETARRPAEAKAEETQQQLSPTELATTEEHYLQRHTEEAGPGSVGCYNPRPGLNAAGKEQLPGVSLAPRES